MAKVFPKNGAARKAARKKAAPAKQNGQLPKAAFADIKNGTLQVRYENNQVATYPLHVLEPQLHPYILRGARVENGNVILPVNSFDITLTPARLLALTQPAGPLTRDSLPGRILKTFENFAGLLEKELKKRNWSYVQLSEKTGIPRTTFSNYRSRYDSKDGKSRVSLENFFKTLKAFNIKLEDL